MMAGSPGTRGSRGEQVNILTRTPRRRQALRSLTGVHGHNRVYVLPAAQWAGRQTRALQQRAFRCMLPPFLRPFDPLPTHAHTPVPGSPPAKKFNFFGLLRYSELLMNDNGKNSYSCYFWKQRISNCHRPYDLLSKANECTALLGRGDGC